MAIITDSASIIELTPQSTSKGSNWVNCVVSIEIHINGDKFRVEFIHDGGMLSIKECMELIQTSKEYIRRINNYKDEREHLPFRFDPLEGRFTIEMEDFDLPSDAELNYNYIILTFSMTLGALDENSQTDLQVSTSFHTGQVLNFIDQFEQELYVLIARVNN